MINKIDRRGSDRLPTTLDWLCVVQISRKEDVIVSEIRNISRSGLKCHVGDFFETGSVVSLLLLLPVKENGLHFRRIDVRSEIVRCQPVENEEGVYDLGCRFDSLEESTQRNLNQYMQLIEKG